MLATGAAAGQAGGLPPRPKEPTAAMSAPIPPLPELSFAPVPPASRHRYTGDRFSYMAAGPQNAPPLVLLHGIGANSMHWRFQLAELADRWRVIAWNAPGYLLSDTLAADAPTGRDYADALHDFLATLGIDRLHLLGNSFGSRVAQWFAALHPGRIDRLVMTGTGIGQRDMPPDRRAALLAAREQQIAAGSYAFGDRVGALLGAGASAETVALVRHTLRGTNPRGFLQAARCVLHDSWTPDFAAPCTMPVLLIQGSEDRVNPADRNAAVLAAALPNVRLVTLDGIGHLPEVEAWQRVNALVRGFLDQA